jgi:preprotein translocase subunit SecE
VADKDEAESSKSTPADDAARSPESPEFDGSSGATALPPELADDVDGESPAEDSSEPDDVDGRGVEDEERVPEPVGARGADSGSSRAARSGSDASVRAAAKAPVKKDRPTARRDTADKVQRTGPVTFVKESVAELRKVVYPTGPQLVNYFIVVLIFVLFVIAYVSLLDLGLGAAMFRIFA